MAEQASEKEHQVKNRIMGWLELSDAPFTTAELDKDLGLRTPNALNARAQVLHRLCAEGVLKHAGSRGRYRKISDAAPLIDWQSADAYKPIDLLWPFSLEKWVAIYEKSVIVIAGESNAGKTAFAFNFIHRNMHRPEIQHMGLIQYLCSEMGRQEIALRAGLFPQPCDWRFEARECDASYADAIKPDGINIVDFLDVTNEFWLVGQEIKEIWEKLTTGIAIVCIQKDADRLLGHGKSFSISKSRMYLSMGYGKLTIVKGKNWAQAEQNPKGKEWKFNIINGWKFVPGKEPDGNLQT